MRYQPTRRQLITTGTLLATGSAIAGTASARPRVFTTGLDGEAHDIDTTARGQALFKLRGDSLTFKLIVANIEDVLMAHIHLDDDVIGPVAVWLHDFDTEAPAPVDGRVNGILSQGAITDEHVGQAAAGDVDTVADLIDEIDAGNAWVNVHTDAHPGGQIGGRIQPRG